MPVTSASASASAGPAAQQTVPRAFLQVRSAVAHTAAAAGAGIVELNLELTDLQVRPVHAHDLAALLCLLSACMFE